MTQKNYEAEKKSKRDSMQATTNQTADVPEYNLLENFISTNAYTCVEINAHSLIKLIIKLRGINQPDLFLPFLVGSQSRERSFCQLRSMTTSQSTVVNFSMLEMIARLKRVQLQSEIVSTTDEQLKFPHIQNKKTKSLLSKFPKDEEIL